MIPETGELFRISDLSEDEFSLFRAALRVLLSKTFIIRGLERDEQLYDFAINNLPIFDAWFSCMDARIVRDEGRGVIAFRGGSDTRFRLGREETCALLVFRLLYEEKRAELSLSAFPSVTVFDFLQKYGAMVDDQLRKTRLVEVLRRLQTHKLIEITSPDPSEMDGMIILYPSLALSVDKDSIDELIASLAPKEEGGGDKE
ncbi:MAG: DUF4194 domain-containing protein [Spirochaetia bacterium]|jgi:hypothetical protein|nr:DUF4194 domain-containing protein [Spirochaetia bacterium]